MDTTTPAAHRRHARLRGASTGRTVARIAVFLLVTAVGTLAAALLVPRTAPPAGAETPVDAAARHADRPGAESAERAARVLLTGPADEALSALPDDFAEFAGYQPRIVDTGPAGARSPAVIAPSGDCSSPVPLPEVFDDPCRAHDLGYDLLRYAAARGTPLGAWARRGFDDRFAAELHAACPADDAGCAAAATTAHTAVAVNSWRQHHAVPVEEDLGLYLLGGASLGAIALAAMMSAYRVPAGDPASRPVGVPVPAGAAVPA